jgi:hypothetical protein
MKDIPILNPIVVTNLAKQLDIELPKNNDFKSKTFVKHCKEKLNLKLFGVLNKANGINLDFNRN